VPFGVTLGLEKKEKKKQEQGGMHSLNEKRNSSPKDAQGQKNQGRAKEFRDLPMKGKKKPGKRISGWMGLGERHFCD